MSQDEQRALKLAEEYLNSYGCESGEGDLALASLLQSEYQRGYEAGLEAAAQSVESYQEMDVDRGFSQYPKIISTARLAAAIRALPRKG